MTKKTSLYDRHVMYKGQMVEFAGYYLPMQFEGIIKEHQKVRNSVGIFDVSHMGEILVKGKEAEKFADFLVTNFVSSLEENQICYTLMCYENGNIVDDLLVYKYNKEKLLLVVNASNIEKDYNHIISLSKNYEVEIENISDITSQLAIQGPKAQSVVQKIVDFNLDEIKYYYFKEISLFDDKVIISRTGYTGEDGFEIYCSNEKALYILDKLLENGKDEEISLIGLGARDTLRLEAKLMLYGNDLNDNINPLMAKLNWAVKFDKEDFNGKKALLDIKENKKNEFTLAGFTMLDKGIARHDYEVYLNENEKIGYVTSGTLSPSLNKAIGLCYIKKEYNKVGNELYIKLRDKLKKMVLVKTPFYKGSVKSKKD